MKMKKQKIYLPILLFLLLIGFCTPYKNVEAAAKLTKKSILIVKGQTCQLRVKGSKKKIKWSVQNKKIATVTSKGKVKGRQKGVTYIYAKTAGKKLKCKVKVETPKLNKKSLVLYEGQSYQLKLKGTTQKVSWRSPDIDIARVNRNGKVTAVIEGDTEIIASISGKKYYCKVTVFEKDDSQDNDSTNNTQNNQNNNQSSTQNNDKTNQSNSTQTNKNDTVNQTQPVISINSIQLNQKEVILEAGKSVKLAVSIAPGNATNKKVIYSSSNSNIAQVDQNGKVNAKGAGIATITAKTEEGGKTASCTVKVYQKNVLLSTGSQINELKLANTSLSLDVSNGTVANKNNVQVWNANNTAAQQWRFDDYMRQYGGYALIPGCGLQAGYVLDGYRGTAAPAAGQNIDLYEFNDKTAQIWNLVKMFDGTYKVMLHGTNYVLEATGTSSGSNVILGTFNINNVRQNWNIRPAANISVTGVSLNKKDEFLEAGHSLNLTATVVPSNASDKMITYSSNNLNVAKVDNSGKVTAVSAGIATITVQTRNGNKTASCNIKVYQKNVAIGSGYKVLKLFGTNRNIDLNNGEVKNGSKIHLWNDNNSNAQKWRIDDYRSKYGGYSLVTGCGPNAGYVLDVYRGNAQPAVGQKIDLWQFNDQPAQIWQFVKLYNGLYKVMLKGTNLVIEAKSLAQGSEMVLGKFDLNNGKQDWSLWDTSLQGTGGSNSSSADKLVSVAQGQIGYLETTYSNGAFWSKYGQWYGYPNSAWCAMFVSWCANQAGISTNIIPKFSSCGVGIQWFQNNGRWHTKSGYTPQKGDIIFLNGGAHVGLVESVGNGKVVTIEGNVHDGTGYNYGVRRLTYSVNSGSIYGYGNPNY